MTDTYQILVYDSASDLEKAVNDFRDKGWEISGNLVMSAVAQPANPNGPMYPTVELWFAQAMTRFPEPILFEQAKVAESSLAHSEN